VAGSGDATQFKLLDNENDVVRNNGREPAVLKNVVFTGFS